MSELPARYQLGPLLGVGATARVHRAHDAVLDAPRAVKILKEGANHEIATRLLREARAMARVRHPHILRVYDAGDLADGRAWVVTDVAEGGSLAHRIAVEGPLRLPEGLRLGVQMLEGLHAAHLAGIVHRDVKPENVLLDRHGDVLLADFGIAALTGAVGHTDVGTALGTFAYMAPEQRLDASTVGPAADQYAAAATLYQALTASNPIDLFAAGPHSPRWQGVPEALRDVLRRALAYDPEDRFESAEAFANALRALMDLSPVPGRRFEATTLPPMPTLAEGSGLTAALDQVYKRALFDRLRELRHVRAAAAAGSREALAAVRRIAHALRGSGATYGYPEITDRAAAVENALDRDELPPLDRLIDTLKEVLTETAGQRHRVLVAVADPVTSSVLQVALQRADRMVVAVDTVAGAREVLRDRPIAAAVLDAVLPDADGRALLDDPNLFGVPVIVVAGGAGAALRADLVAHGAAAVFEKPVDPNRLAAALTSLLARTGSEPHVRDPATGMPGRIAFRDAIALAQGASQPSRAFVVAHVVPPAEVDAAVWSAILRGHLDEDLLVARLDERAFGVMLFDPVDAATAALDRALRAADAHAGAITPSTAGLVPGGTATVTDVLVAAARMAHHAVASGQRVAVSDELAPVAGRVVLVEDDPATAALVVRLLTEDGLRVDHAADGHRAAALLRGDPPALVLLDVHLPGPDGFSLLQQLREAPATARVPALMLTAVGDERQVAMAFELGADDYVVKPFRPMELRARVRRLLRRPR
jgi:DNA-binding response OmpR family regulator